MRRQLLKQLHDGVRTQIFNPARPRQPLGGLRAGGPRAAAAGAGSGPGPEPALNGAAAGGGGAGSNGRGGDGGAAARLQLPPGRLDR